MRVGIHSKYGVCGFLTDKGIEAFGPGKKMPDSARFQTGSNLEVVWRSIPCPKGLNKPKPELFTHMIRNEAKISSKQRCVCNILAPWCHLKEISVEGQRDDVCNLQCCSVPTVAEINVPSKPSGRNKTCA